MADVALDSLDGVPEALHGLFKEADGKFVLSAGEDVSGLKSALEKERRAAQKASRELAAIREKVDIDKYEELLSAAEQAEAEKAKREGDWESMKAKLVEKHDQERAKWQEREDKLLGEIRKDKVESAALMAINEHQANATLLLPHIQSRAEVVETDTGFEVRVMDGRGEAMIADSDGNPLGIAGLVESLKQDEKYQPAFPSSGRGGSGGSEGSGGSDGSAGTVDRNDPLAWGKHAEQIASGEMNVA